MDTHEAQASLRSFFGSSKEHHIKRRQPIIRMNQASEYVYLIKQGVASYFSYTDAGDAVIHYLYKQNELFPLTQLFSPVEYGGGFTAFTDIVVERKPIADLRDYLDERPETMIALLEQQNSSYEGMVTLNVSSAKKRVTTWLLSLSARFGHRESDYIDINLPITIQDFASCVRLSRESAGRILKLLEQEGAVIVGKQRIIIYPDRLEAYS